MVQEKDLRSHSRIGERVTVVLLFDYSKEDIIMVSSDRTTRIFIHHRVLASEAGVEKLKELFFLTKEFPNSMIIKDVKESGELNIISSTPIQQKCSLTDCHFQYFIAQKIEDGYLYGTIESFKHIVGDFV